MRAALRAARLLLPVPLLLLLTTAGDATPNPGPFKKIAVLRLREATEEMIDPSVKQSILRRIEEAREWGADCVVLDIESYGGLVLAALETGDEIYALGRDVHTIAFIDRKAISAAALLSLACQEIVMNEVAEIGDCQAVTVGADGKMEQAPEKIQSAVAAKFKVYGQGNGYPVPVLEAMVRQEMGVIRYRRRVDGGWDYFRSDTTDDLPDRRKVEEEYEGPPQTVDREGELAIFPARQAVEYGIASRIEPSLDALLKSLSGPGTEVAVFDWNWAERTSRFLLGYKWLLFLVGLGAIYFAFKMPGTGVPEALAIVSFGLFFGASAIAGFAGPIEMVLFLVGVALLVVEIFILPGFGVAGFAGLACVFVSIGLAAVPETAGDQGLPLPTSDYLLPMAGQFLIGGAGAIGLAFLLARYLPHIPYFNRLALAPAAPQTGSGVPLPQAPSHPLLGATGVAETDLRPAGRAKIGAEHLDVVAEGFVAPGTRVRVVAVRGSVVVVRPEK
jgi:membrane-bound serine protease (ClpP class)